VNMVVLTIVNMVVLTIVIVVTELSEIG